MTASEPGLLARHPWVARRRLTVDEYHRMGEAAILREDDRVELIEGELVAMVPIGSEHYGTVNALNRLLMLAVGDGAIVSPQNPVRLEQASEPQPDMVLLKPRLDFYRKKVITPDDVLLLIEVAHSSVAYDRTVKAPLYARHGITEYWLVRLDVSKIEVYREPGPDSYQSLRTALPGETLDIAALPGVTLQVADIIGV